MRGMLMKKVSNFIFIVVAIISVNSHGQCNDVVQQCRDKINSAPLSLGGSVQQLLLLNNTIQVPISLAANTTYRVTACSADSTQEMTYHILNADNNVLFKSVANSSVNAYESFQVTDATQGMVYAQLTEPTIEPVCAALVLGSEK